ncbi:MAG: hypothetical protein LIO52_04945, partial [Oscillospiraceae bacterium]|nr:hypothetical protein [Oscillospiraceae bacterium]
KFAQANLFIGLAAAPVLSRLYRQRGKPADLNSLHSLNPQQNVGHEVIKQGGGVVGNTSSPV